MTNINAIAVELTNKVAELEKRIVALELSSSANRASSTAVVAENLCLKTSAGSQLATIGDMGFGQVSANLFHVSENGDESIRLSATGVDDGASFCMYDKDGAMRFRLTCSENDGGATLGFCGDERSIVAGLRFENDRLSIILQGRKWEIGVGEDGYLVFSPSATELPIDGDQLGRLQEVIHFASLNGLSLQVAQAFTRVGADISDGPEELSSPQADSLIETIWEWIPKC